MFLFQWQDTHANENGSIYVDKIQDVELLVAFENKTHTTIAIKRAIIAGNKEDLTIEVRSTLSAFTF